MSDEYSNNDNENLRGRSSKRFNKKKRKRGGRFYIGLFILLIVVLCGGYIGIEKFMPNFNMVPLLKFFPGMDGNKIYIVVGEERIEVSNHPVLENNEVYIPVDFVKEYIDKYIFWDESVGRLTITTENKVIQMKTEELAYYINAKPFNLNIPVNSINGVAYMPSIMLMDLYDIIISYDENYNMAVIDYTTEERHISKVTAKSTNLRYKASIKSPIELKLEKDTKVVSYGEYGKFTKVRTESGLIGYVKTKDIVLDQTIPAIEKKDVKQSGKSDYKPIKGKINIIWDQISSADASADVSRRITHKGIDVLSPTWFSFDAEKLNGDIVNIADKGYVEWAHDNGYQVWGLITDNFDYNVSHAVLSDTNIREYVVKQLLYFVSLYNMDGINIDFENVGEGDADYYIQFLRELYPLLKEQGVTLSVDMKVPKPYSLYYNRTEVGKTSDYVIIMGYDEHYSTSPVSGSVASIGFVEEGVVETLKEVPAEKTVLALPYYVRVWTETEKDGETKVKSKAYTMSDAIAMFEANGAEFEWLETTANYYAEYETQEDGETVIKKVWLEDERSIEEKLKISEKYDIAGIAGWSAYWLKGEDKDKILDLVYKYVKQ